MAHRVARHLVIPAAVLLSAGCFLFRDGEPGRPYTAPTLPSDSPKLPANVLAAADAALPEASLTRLATYSGNRLYTYLDGAAEAYFDRGFLKLATADVAGGHSRATAELYLLATADGAAELFGDLSDGKGEKLPAGRHGALWATTGLEGIFHRGPYFCRLAAPGNDEAARQLLNTLAAAIDKSIP